VPPTAFELSRLVAACTWDAILYEFARTLAARRSKLDQYRSVKGGVVLVTTLLS
jgi:hypothetical protein